MGILLRLENENDYREVENLTREAFWDVYKPGCEEHLVLHKIRKTPAFIPELDYIAMEEDKIVGHIIYSKAKVIDLENNEHEVITFGPISVLPTYQGRGIGSALIEHTKKIACDMRYKAVVIFGNPAYYHRFGFHDAKNYGITTSEGENFDAFMAMELYEGSLNGIRGKFFEDPAFHTEKEELVSFEKGFPPKEKTRQDNILKKTGAPE